MVLTASNPGWVYCEVLQRYYLFRSEIEPFCKKQKADMSYCLICRKEFPPEEKSKITDVKSKGIELLSSVLRKARALIKNECCNFMRTGPFKIKNFCPHRETDNAGVCFYFSDGQAVEPCGWFENAVLPLDGELKEEYLEGKEAGHDHGKSELQSAFQRKATEAGVRDRRTPRFLARNQFRCPRCGRLEYANASQDRIKMCSMCLMGSCMEADSKSGARRETEIQKPAAARRKGAVGTCERCREPFRKMGNRQLFCDRCRRGARNEKKRVKMRSYRRCKAPKSKSLVVN